MLLSLTRSRFFLGALLLGATLSACQTTQQGEEAGQEGQQNEQGADDEQGEGDNQSADDGGGQAANNASNADSQANPFADEGGDEGFEQLLGQNTNGNAAAAPVNTAPAPVPAPMPAPVASESQAVVTTASLTSSRFAGAPPLSKGRRVMAAGEAPEEYLVEAGDTLTDICEQLLGEPGYWPKLWALNTYIKNPHFIWPGMRLRFYPGDDDAPPFLEVVTEEEFLPPGEGHKSLAWLTQEGLVPPPAAADDKAAIVTMADLGPFEGGLETVGKLYRGYQTKVTTPGYILPQELAPLCEVEGGLQGEDELHTGMSFTCAVDEEQGSGLKTSSKYTVLRYAGEVDDEEGEEIGHQYLLVGHVSLDSLADENSRGIGMIKFSQIGMHKGDLLVAPMPSEFNLDLRKDVGLASAARGKIVSFGQEGQELGGQGDFVFINKGQAAGMRAGQLYPITQNAQAEMKDLGDAPDHTSEVGFVRILDATPVGAVGYIVYSRSEVFRGDGVGKG